MNSSVDWYSKLCQCTVCVKVWDDLGLWETFCPLENLNYRKTLQFLWSIISLVQIQFGNIHGSV